MEFKKNDIIKTIKDINGKFTFPGGIVKNIILLKDNVYKISGINEDLQEIYLVEDYGPGAEINFSDASSFIKI